MIIGISGKIGSGKDTVGKIIQYLTIKSDNKIVEALHETKEIDIIKFLDKWNGNQSDWQIKKFAGKLKQIVSILTGISVEDLEKQEVKDRLLGEDWTRYGYADGFSDVYKDGVKVVTMMNKECSKERYEDELRVNWQTAYKVKYNPRLLMQYIGTDLFRDKLLNNIWVNALFADYKSKFAGEDGFTTHTYDKIKDSQGNYTKITIKIKDHPLFEPSHFPNWIITDMRFPNELQAIKDKGGICVRVNRLLSEGNRAYTEIHPSETALDNATFDYTINNNETIEQLVGKVKEILICERIIS